MWGKEEELFCLTPREEFRELIAPPICRRRQANASSELSIYTPSASFQIHCDMVTFTLCSPRQDLDGSDVKVQVMTEASRDGPLDVTVTNWAALSPWRNGNSWLTWLISCICAV